MNDSLAKIDPTILALMHGSFQNDNQLQPFAREILLTECHVSGTSHRVLHAIEPTLLPGAVLILQREPRNQHDDLAIQMEDLVQNEELKKKYLGISGAG